MANAGPIVHPIFCDAVPAEMEELALELVSLFRTLMARTPTTPARDHWQSASRRLVLRLVGGLSDVVAALNEAGLEPEAGADDLIHGTVIPWIRFTSIKHARHGNAQDSVPKIALGRATKTAEGLRMPVSIEAHHSLVDGVHAGAFFGRLQAAFADPEATFG